MTTRAQRVAQVPHHQGAPICPACRATYRYQPDGDGRVLQECGCGVVYLPTVGVRSYTPDIEEPAPAHAHGQSDSHPWKRTGKFTNHRSD